MKIGTQQIQNAIYEQLTRARVDVPGGRNKFAKDLAKIIYELIGDDMSNRDWDAMHGFPEDLVPLVRKLQTGLGLRMKRDEDAIAVYRWLSEQGDDKIKHFIKWATAEERVQYVGKYRNSPEAIKIDWKMAFKETSPAVMRNADGSLNV